MMMYKIMLVLLIFGGVMGAITDSGLYGVKLPKTETRIRDADIKEFGEGMTGESLNPYTSLSWLNIAGRVLISAAIALFTIMPMLMAYGMPALWALMFQMPVWLVEAWGLYEFFTGHVTIPQD